MPIFRPQSSTGSTTNHAFPPPAGASVPLEPVPIATLKGHPFAAVITMAEVDAAERIGVPWQVKGVKLSRSHVVIQSRRMCHLGRKVVLAVHLIDAVPTPLLGKVIGCEYTNQGKHAIGVELIVMEENPEINEWVTSLHPSRANHRIKPPAAA